MDWRSWWSHEAFKEERAVLRLAWLAIRIVIAIALVVVPFGYAITGLHADVLMGAGCGIAIGLGIGLRGGPQSGLWTGILVGAIVGVVAALIAGLVPGNPDGLIVPQVLALAVGLIAGLRGADVSGYRDLSREALIVAVLLALGFLPAWVVQGRFEEGFLSNGSLALVAAILLFAWVALIAGLLSHRREGWTDTRPPLLLVAGATFVPVFLTVGMVTGEFEDAQGVSGIYLALAIVLMIAIVGATPAIAFLVGRTFITWLEPRLRVYGNLADYLRVMWVPIGAFAVGYLTIIGLFAGFYGTLERFQPGAFTDPGTGITDWLSFAFFSALGQDFAAMKPVSVHARVLVGTHLILSAGWAVVLFAAVMSSIGPKLDRIARRLAEEDDE